MRSLVEETALVGTRVSVTGEDGAPLGLGTYIWMNEIILDIGKIVTGKETTWEAADAPPAKPFLIELAKDARYFDRDDGSLRAHRMATAGSKVEIELVKHNWNHGGYLFGKFYHNRSMYWFLIAELSLVDPQTQGRKTAA